VTIVALFITEDKIRWRSTEVGLMVYRGGQLCKMKPQRQVPNCGFLSQTDG